jgi:hypothetical protein
VFWGEQGWRQVCYGNEKQERQTQIPCGNDNRKGKNKGRFPAGVTTGKAKAEAEEGQKQTQIPCGNDKQGQTQILLERTEEG